MLKLLSLVNKMSRLKESYTKDVKRVHNIMDVKNVSTYLLEKIQKEYELKRQPFHPSSISPNIFMGKLELRLKIYYKHLYKNANLETK